MKRLAFAVAFSVCAGSAAFAADLPPPVAPPPRAPATYVPVSAPYFSWTGIYIGVNGGYGFGNSNWTTPAPCAFSTCTTGSFSTDGFLVGGTVGGNYQMGSFVIGLEGDGDWTNINGTYSGGGGGCGVGGNSGCQTRNDWLATVRGRAGYAWDRVLFYGTGGAAFGNIQANVAGLNSPTTLSDQVGWTLGGGIEAAFAPNWTAKAEYLYVNLGSANCSTAICGGPTTVPLTENLIRAGVNYKFW
jgi:outer membrane immunogenic protein